MKLIECIWKSTKWYTYIEPKMEWAVYLCVKIKDFYLKKDPVIRFFFFFWTWYFMKYKIKMLRNVPKIFSDDHIDHRVRPLAYRPVLIPPNRRRNRGSNTWRRQAQREDHACMHALSLPLPLGSRNHSLASLLVPCTIIIIFPIYRIYIILYIDQKEIYLIKIIAIHYIWYDI